MWLTYFKRYEQIPDLVTRKIWLQLRAKYDLIASANDASNYSKLFLFYTACWGLWCSAGIPPRHFVWDLPTQSEGLWFCFWTAANSGSTLGKGLRVSVCRVPLSMFTKQVRAAYLVTTDRGDKRCLQEWNVLESTQAVTNGCVCVSEYSFFTASTVHFTFNRSHKMTKRLILNIVLITGRRKNP